MLIDAFAIFFASMARLQRLFYFRPAKDNSAKERSKRLMKAKNITNASINISFNFIEILRPR